MLQLVHGNNQATGRCVHEIDDGSPGSSAAIPAGKRLSRAFLLATKCNNRSTRARKFRTDNFRSLNPESKAEDKLIRVLRWPLRTCFATQLPPLLHGFQTPVVGDFAVGLIVLGLDLVRLFNFFKVQRKLFNRFVLG
jgi:hypothetical protein